MCLILSIYQSKRGQLVEMEILIPHKHVFQTTHDVDSDLEIGQPAVLGMTGAVKVRSIK